MDRQAVINKEIRFEGVDWYVMNIAMSGRFNDTLVDIETRWTFERSHRAYVAIYAANEVDNG